MKINRKVILRIAAFILIGLSVTAIVYSIIRMRVRGGHDSIIIWSNEDMLRYDFEGEGTKENPFLIQDLSIITTNRYGIYITNVTYHFIIENCYISADYIGIQIEHSASETAIVSDNICENNEIGIKIVNTDSVRITNNNCSFNIETGIEIWVSNNTFLSDNICNSNKIDGIFITGSSNLIISNNICENNGNTGISFEKSEEANSLISTNKCDNNFNGIKIIDSNSLLIENNDCSSNVVTGLSIIGTNYSVIEGNICNFNGDDGINFIYVSNTTLANNICIDNSETAFDFIYVYYVTIVNNVFSGSQDGIFCGVSSDLQILNNTIINNQIGIDTVADIWIWWIDNSIIAFNLFQDNELYAIYLSVRCENTTVHHNSFIDNNEGGTSQAYDSGYDDRWYDAINMEGNFWSEWSGVGNYSIDGFAHTFDLYPLLENPLITYYFPIS